MKADLAVSSIEFDDQPLPATGAILVRREEIALDPEKLPDSSYAARDLTALLRVATHISTIRSVESVQWQLLGLIFEVIPADRGTVLLLVHGSEEVSSVAAWDRISGPAASVRLSRAIIHKVIQDRVGLLIEYPPNATNSSGGVSQSHLCVPIMISGHLLGVIYLDGPGSGRFTQHHLQLVSAVAGIAALGIENARQLESLRNENQRLRIEAGFEHDMIGESPAMADVLQKMARVAATDSTVLICGESGTGKELAAHALHRNSPRAEKPFVTLNCAAITETLLESELFGHEKGSFTGAIAAKRGQMEIADGGAIFLDEIGELAPSLQAKLLRALQQREFLRVGGTRPIRVDVRLIAATNKDLAAEVRAGRFRQDLYYRLNVVSLNMPPLRERRSDVVLLAQYFAGVHGHKCKRAVKGLSPEAAAAVQSYSWPGNVRELENAIERAVVLGSGEWILAEDLPESVLEAEPSGTPSSHYHEAVLAFKKDLIAKAVDQAGGNYTEAARLLDLHPNYLHRLMRNMNLKRASVD